MAHDWFGCMCAVLFCVSQVFAEAVHQSPPCFPYVDFLAQRAGYAIDDISGDACKMASDFNGTIGSSDLNFVRSKGTSFTLCVFKWEGSWLVAKLKCAPN